MVCHDCSREILTAPCKRSGAPVVRAGLATVTTTPSEGETVYRAHAPWCGKVAT